MHKLRHVHVVTLCVQCNGHSILSKGDALYLQQRTESCRIISFSFLLPQFVCSGSPLGVQEDLVLFFKQPLSNELASYPGPKFRSTQFNCNKIKKRVQVVLSIFHITQPRDSILGHNPTFEKHLLKT